ncbi:MAG: helix-turn-helix domain-containing protein [Scandinavium sp.]|uniref:helix-turn-helix domain-containing protein n=1 Tax=Scandinavium sp. TaxID=2830653 RepID=UPI003F3DFCA8
MTTKIAITLPDSKESELALRGQQALEAWLSTRQGSQRITLMGENEESHTLELPTSAMQMLAEILRELAAGNAVQVVPVHAELTTQEAANILNVSRPHLVKLLEAGRISFHKIGRHRRILFSDLMAYKNKREHESLDIMQALTDEAQDLGMY